MNILEEFVLNLQLFIINDKETNHNIIRKHTKKLEELGDLSFPLSKNNWYQLIGNSSESATSSSIFSYKYKEEDDQSVLNRLVQISHEWTLSLSDTKIKNNDVHLYLRRSSLLYKAVIQHVMFEGKKYGSSKIQTTNFDIKIFSNVDLNSEEIDLSTLRLVLLKDVANNFLKYTTSDDIKENFEIFLSTQPNSDGFTNILCGPVLNENGVKSTYMSQTLYQKRSADMRMMAQHKYGIQVKQNSSWEQYFEKLGTGSVTVEMLSNKPQKCIKISPNDLQSANKGAAFIFYNCARLAALFKEFDKKVSRQEYPNLPQADQVDFSLLTQPEEWELFYVYILQFPLVIKSCVQDMKKGIFNPQYLISFLANLSSVFSVYYRRVRILTNPKEHMFSTIHARLYLLKGLQCVFHNALLLLNIEPIREM